MHTRYYTNPSMDKLAGVIGNPPSISFIRKNFYTKAFSGDYYVTARLNKEYKNSYINGFVVDVSKNIWWFGVPNQDSIDKAKNLLKSVPLMNKDGDFDWVKLVKKIYIPAGLPLGKTSLRSFDEGNYDTQIIKY